MPEIRHVPAGQKTAEGRPADPRLVDRFHRVATDLRVSLTDRCNLRCTYCMPPEGLDWTPGHRLLSDAEIIRLVTVAVEQLGVERIRFTGGEPLLHRGLEDVVRETARLRTAAGTPPETSLTTNGIGLAARAPGLRAAGLRRVNVSLDTLDRARFLTITRRDRLAEVLEGLRGAAAAGLRPVKVNAVLLRGVNDDEAVPLLRWALRHGYELRFIEQMPLEPHHTWTRDDLVTAHEILADLRGAFDLAPVHPATRGAAPAETWLVTGDRADTGDRTARAGCTVGVIAAVTRPFCGDCDRTRLTADGQVRSCLFAREETDLRGALRRGASDAELADLWRAAMWAKQPGHGLATDSFRRPERPMSAIGG